ncbi:MAG: helix-turn-helix domain-containing protein [Oscillospiraceae bacterium]|nr:helix-turn-helix domain-containing protein [Oscillospiraceae bacterium]
MTFGEKVRTARVHADLSQQDLARMTGMSLRTIQNYESGERLPKKRSTYTVLAKELHVDEGALLDDNAEFILSAAEQYGYKGKKQALKLTEEVAGLYAGGSLEEEDMDAMMKAIQEAYWRAKEINKKYTPKKYLNNGNEEESPTE